jgi:hypothetical protein
MTNKDMKVIKDCIKILEKDKAITREKLNKKNFDEVAVDFKKWTLYVNAIYLLRETIK